MTDLFDPCNVGYLDVTEFGVATPDIEHLPAIRRRGGEQYDFDNGQGFRGTFERVGRFYHMIPAGQRDYQREGGRHTPPIPYVLDWHGVI